jgi:hypothetical protein
VVEDGDLLEFLAGGAADLVGAGEHERDDRVTARDACSHGPPFTLS